MAQLSYIVLIIALNALICVFAEEELYSTEYDDIDVLSLLENEDVREEYYKCFMGTGPCKTEQEKVLTERFSEAFQTNCRKCTPKQIEWLNTVVDWYVKNQPEQWQLIIEKTVEKMKKKN